MVVHYGAIFTYFVKSNIHSDVLSAIGRCIVSLLSTDEIRVYIIKPTCSHIIDLVACFYLAGGHLQNVYYIY